MKNTFLSIKITEQARQSMNFGCFQFYLESLTIKMLYRAIILMYSCAQRVYKWLVLILVDTHSFNAGNLLRKVYQPVVARLVQGSASLHIYTCWSGPKFFLNCSLSALHSSLLHYGWPSQI